MPTTSSTRLHTPPPAQPRTRRPNAALFVVVGFDGSDPSRAALEAAVELISGRRGHLEVVYVAHLPASVMISAPALQGVREGFEVIARDLLDSVHSALDDREPRWHFGRRDGAVAPELIAAARELRRQHGPESVVVIVVGSAEHRLHHVIGSTAATLTHEREFGLVVVPRSTGAPRSASEVHDSTSADQPSRPAPENDVWVERHHAEGVLRRAGFSKDEISDVLGSVDFPAPMSVVSLRGQQFGISTGSLMERLGSSP